jgi:pimeloyl-ACP methyl ester carboxylesterase
MSDAASGGQARVALVHGAFHGAWCWDPVTDRLAAAGIEATAIDLPGHGADPGPLGDLYTDADRVRAVLDTLAPPVVLVGHSYGGAVITDAGAHPAVAHLVYIASFALDEGESCMRSIPMARPAPPPDGPSLADAMVTSADGSATLNLPLAAAAFYHDCDEDTAAWAVAHLGRQSMSSMRQSPRAVAWRERPSTYVVCTDDRAVDPGLQRLHAARCTTAVEWPTSHSPFLSRPELVTDLLVQLATTVGATD